MKDVHYENILANYAPQLMTNRTSAIQRQTGTLCSRQTLFNCRYLTKQTKISNLVMP
jgi:hypothetical protein